MADQNPQMLVRHLWIFYFYQLDYEIFLCVE